MNERCRPKTEHLAIPASAWWGGAKGPGKAEPSRVPLRPSPQRLRSLGWPRSFDREVRRERRERFRFEVRFDQRRAFGTRSIADRDHKGIAVVVELHFFDFADVFLYASVAADPAQVRRYPATAV